MKLKKKFTFFILSLTGDMFFFKVIIAVVHSIMYSYMYVYFYYVCLFIYVCTYIYMMGVYFKYVLLLFSH